MKNCNSGRTPKKGRGSFVKAIFACRGYEDGFTLLEVCFTLALFPLLVLLIVQLLTFTYELNHHDMNSLHPVSRILVRKVWDSDDCRVVDGTLRGRWIRDDGTPWTWTLKAVNGQLLLVGEEGGNLLIVRDVQSFDVIAVEGGFRLSWQEDKTVREKMVSCRKTGSM